VPLFGPPYIYYDLFSVNLCTLECCDRNTVYAQTFDK